MKKILLTFALACGLSSPSFAFTKDQSQDMGLKTIRVQCINPVNNKPFIFSGSRDAIYISQNSGLLVIRAPGKVITISPSYCLIEGIR